MNNSIQEINQKLEKLQETAYRRLRIKNHILRIDAQLQGLRMDQKALEKSLDKEHGDVIRLEEMTVSYIFYSILGSIEKQLEIERQEYLMEVLKYNELIDSIELLEYEQIVLQETFDSIPDEKNQLQFLIKEKEQLLRDVDKGFAIKITLHDQSIENKTLQINNMKQALIHGEKALQLLNNIKDDLANVKEWGVWQYYGAGNYSAYAKKTYIDRARKNSVKASMLLNNFENTLSDLFNDLEISKNLSLEKFELFLNMFYDNLITDWIVQKHIKNAFQNIQMTMDKVTRLISTVEMGQKKLSELIEQLKIERNRLIVEA